MMQLKNYNTKNLQANNCFLSNINYYVLPVKDVFDTWLFSLKQALNTALK